MYVAGDHGNTPQTGLRVTSLPRDEPAKLWDMDVPADPARRDLLPDVPIVQEGARLPISGDEISFVCVMRNGYATLHALSDSLLAIASFKWGSDSDGELTGVSVHPDWQRRGVANLLWKVATQLSEEQGWAPPVHSDVMTEAGARFAASTSAQLPESVETAEAGDDGFDRPSD